MVPGTDEGSKTDETAATEDAGAGSWLNRRLLLRLIIVLAVGIPIVVEGLTFIGLVGEHIDDDGAANGPNGADGDGVEIGEDLLPATDQRETLSAAQVVVSEGWTLTLAVDVNNTGADGYSLRLGEVTTGSGAVVAGDHATGAMAAGGTTSLSGTWDLPEGQIAETVRVTATVPGPDGPQTVSREVRLARVPVSG